MLRALAQNGGVVMINFYPVYIDEAAAKAARLYFSEFAAALKEIYEIEDPGARGRAAD